LTGEHGKGEAIGSDTGGSIRIPATEFGSPIAIGGRPH